MGTATHQLAVVIVTSVIRDDHATGASDATTFVAEQSDVFLHRLVVAIQSPKGAYGSCFSGIGTEGWGDINAETDPILSHQPLV